MSESVPTAPTSDRGHRLARMTGRNPREAHRSATPLELLFDLSFVVAFAQAGDQFAHLVASGHVVPGVTGFFFAVFGACWAWINFSWFSSAYDTDDWFYRLTTMVQMIGVVVYALGMPVFFATLEHGGHIDNSVLLAGYIIMRVAMVAQWLRAAKQDPTRRRTALSYAFFVGTAQVGWVIVTLLDLPFVVFFTVAVALFVYECVGPVLSERKSSGTPWHAHHIAERYGLLAIIALGEGVFGTVSAVSALVQEQDWSTEAVLVVIAGIGITFGLWWNYFLIPSGEVLARFRGRAFVWGYGHVFIYGAIAATGAGLHVAAYVLEGHAAIGMVGAVLAVAIPVLIFAIALFAIHWYLLRQFDSLHIGLFAGSVALLVLAVLLAGQGVPLGWCLIVVTLSPAVIVVGYETVGHRHQVGMLERALR